MLNKLETEATPNISFLGALDNTKTKEYIKSARAVITATKMYEGQPRLLSEAASFEFRRYTHHLAVWMNTFPKVIPINLNNLIMKI